MPQRGALSGWERMFDFSAEMVASRPRSRGSEARARPGGSTEDGVQHPLLLMHRGGRDPEVVEWEARFAGAMAEFVRRFYADDPPPALSVWAERGPAWVDALRAAAATDPEGTRLRQE